MMSNALVVYLVTCRRQGRIQTFRLGVRGAEGAEGVGYDEP